MPESDQSQIIRRRDLTDLAEVFEAAIAPIEQVTEHMELATRRYERTSASIKEIRKLLLATCVLVVVVLLMMMATFFQFMSAYKMQMRLAEKQRVLSGRVDNAVSVLEAVERSTRETNSTIAEVKEQTDTGVKIVPETDPEKAKEAPVKLVFDSAPVAVVEEKPAEKPAPPKAKAAVAKKAPSRPKPKAKAAPKAAPKPVEVPLYLERK